MFGVCQQSYDDRIDEFTSDLYDYFLIDGSDLCFSWYWGRIVEYHSSTIDQCIASLSEQLMYVEMIHSFASTQREHDFSCELFVLFEMTFVFNQEESVTNHWYYSYNAQ
jgi:hypothetical protein